MNPDAPPVDLPPVKTMDETYPIVMRVFFPVFFAVLAAIGAAYGGYHFWVQVPERRAANIEAANRLLNAEKDERKYDAITGLTTVQLEFKLKADDPDSPCNSLEDESFAMCASYQTRDAQRQMVELIEKQKQQPK